MTQKETRIPIWEEFIIYLKGQKGVKIDSGILARYRYTYHYFKNKEFNLSNFRTMLYELLEGTGGKPKPLKKSSVNKYITLGKHLCVYLRLDFMKDFTTYEVDEPPITIIDEKTQIKLAECYLKRDRKERQDNYRYKCVIYTLTYTGMRPSEICNLLWLDYTGETFLVRTSKTKKPRIVPVASKLKPLIDKLPRISPYIFGSIRSQLKPDTINEELQRRCEKLDLTVKFTAKHFRSSFDTLVSRGGGEATLPKIARITGHSMETAYKYYLKYDIKDLQDALESSHPLLKGNQDIDTLKRTLLEVVKKIVDLTKFNVSLEITPKDKNIRKLHIS